MFCRLITFSCLLLCQVVLGQAQTAAQNYSNIVLLIADDLGYGELGCQGNPQIPTPNIDALAQSGVRCTQAYVTAPNCSPSRAGLFTGRTPTRFGYEFNPIGARNEDPGTGLPRSEVTIAEMLQAAGYTTGLIGKWHLGGAPDFDPLRHGFDEFFGFKHEGHFFVPPPWRETTTMLRRKVLPAGSAERFQVSERLIYSSHMGHNEPPYDANNPLLRGGQPVAEAEYLTDAFSREAVDFIERHQDAPFFLSVAYNAVHSPLQAKQDTLTKLDSIDDMHRRIFAAMLSDLDTGVGRVVEAVDHCGLREKTLILFLSDNGGPTRELTSSNFPLRDGKGSMYEGGLRIPFIACLPGRIPAGEVCAEIVSSLDIFPTCAALAGAEQPRRIEGFDLLPLLTDPTRRSSHETLYWRQGGRAALRMGNWKIVAPGRSPMNRSWELYDIVADIAETNNLASQRPEILARLQRTWEQLDQQMAEPLF